MTVKRWANEWDLQVCFECTDWSVFEAIATDLDEMIHQLLWGHVHSYSFNLQWPWFTAKLIQLCQAEEDAYRNGGRVLYKQAKNVLTKEIRVAKGTTLKTWKTSFQPTTLHQFGKAWQKSPITRHQPPALCRIINRLFYCRFEKSHSFWPLHTFINTSNKPLSLPPESWSLGLWTGWVLGLPETED